MPNKPQKTEQDHLSRVRNDLLAAILPNVPFDGWSAQSFAAALADSELDPAIARLACPRGVLDLAMAYHRRGDRIMEARMTPQNLSGLRYSEKVAAGIRFRLEAIDDKEVVRRGLTFFAIPTHAAEGATAIWGTCDLIWKLLGDTSNDLNWYSKRAILSAVYSSTLLFWLGDDSENHSDTWAFLDRRIANVMRFEKFKGGVKKNPLVKGFMRGPGRIFDRIKAPVGKARPDLPGYLTQKP